jgi:hypothetical protein
MSNGLRHNRHVYYSKSETLSCDKVQPAELISAQRKESFLVQIHGLYEDSLKFPSSEKVNFEFDTTRQINGIDETTSIASSPLNSTTS